MCRVNSYEALLQTQHSVHTGNYIADKQKHKDNSHRASSGNGTVQELVHVFLTYTTKKTLRIIGTREMMQINNKTFWENQQKWWNITAIQLIIYFFLGARGIVVGWGNMLKKSSGFHSWWGQ
jgi:hypothetical protein